MNLENSNFEAILDIILDYNWNSEFWKKKIFLKWRFLVHFFKCVTLVKFQFKYMELRKTNMRFNKNKGEAIQFLLINFNDI